MSSARAPLVAAGLACALSAALSATHAQVPAREDAAALARRVRAFDVLASRFDTAFTRAAAEYRERELRLPVDTMVVGRLRAIVRGVPAARARQLLRDADSLWSRSWAARVPPFSATQLELAADLPQGQGQAELIRITVNWPQIGRAALGTNSTTVRFASQNRRNALLEASSVANLMLDPWKNLRPALSATPTMNADTAAMAQSAYEELAASPFLSGRSCLAGRIGACEQVMGLSPFVPPYDDVLDASGRAALLASGNSRDWPVEYTDREACLETLDEETCRRAIANVAPKEIDEFRAYQARGILVRTLLARMALDGRLRASTASSRDAAEDIRLLAGDSLAAYLADVRQSAINHRPKRVLPPAVTSWLALLLLATFAVAGALTSRWRVE